MIGDGRSTKDKVLVSTRDKVTGEIALQHFPEFSLCVCNLSKWTTLALPLHYLGISLGGLCEGVDDNGLNL